MWEQQGFGRLGGEEGQEGSQGMQPGVSGAFVQEPGRAQDLRLLRRAWRDWEWPEDFSRAGWLSAGIENH